MYSLLISPSEILTVPLTSAVCPTYQPSVCNQVTCTDQKIPPCEISLILSHTILLSSRYLWLTLFCWSNRLCLVSSQNNWHRLLFYVQICVT